jgi:hypothetical protein
VAVLAHPRVGAGVAEEVLLVAAGELGCVTGEGELEGIDGQAEAHQGGGDAEPVLDARPGAVGADGRLQREQISGWDPKRHALSLANRCSPSKVKPLVPAEFYSIATIGLDVAM